MPKSCTYPEVVPKWDVIQRYMTELAREKSMLGSFLCHKTKDTRTCMIEKRSNTTLVTRSSEQETGVNSFGRLVDLCGLLLKSSKWTKWPNPLNLQGGLKVSNHLLAEWSSVDFLLCP